MHSPTFAQFNHLGCQFSLNCIWFSNAYSLFSNNFFDSIQLVHRFFSTKTRNCFLFLTERFRIFFGRVWVLQKRLTKNQTWQLNCTFRKSTTTQRVLDVLRVVYLGLSAFLVPTPWNHSQWRTEPPSSWWFENISHSELTRHSLHNCQAEAVIRYAIRLIHH